MAKNNKEQSFETLNKGLESPASVHESLAALTQRQFAENEIPRAIFAQGDGTLVMLDANGVSASYSVNLGQEVSFMPTEIVNTTDIATIIWW